MNQQQLENKLIKAMNDIPNFSKYLDVISKLYHKYERIKACFLFKHDEEFQVWFEQVKEDNPTANTCKLYADCLDALEENLKAGIDLPWEEVR